MYNFNEVQKESNIRTRFQDTHNHKTTGNTGDIIPIYYKEILPGDDIKLILKSLVKMTTPSFQTMDNIFIDYQFYFVPRRLVWEHWKAFQGEKIVGPHENQPEFTIPVTSAPAGGWKENTIADYFGIPTKIENIKVDSAYFRAYCLIYNEWFRDQNRQDFVDFSTGDENTTGSNGGNGITDALKGGKCLKAAKIHDYFTSSLLTPTGSERVTLPLGTTAPVVGDGSAIMFTNGEYNRGLTTITNGYPYLVLANTNNGQTGATTTPAGQGTGADYDNKLIGLNLSNSGLQVRLDEATAATVNQLRMAFQLQKIFEANNRSGNRYIEQLRNRWNVIPSDATLQRPQYLGGKRIPINIQMVIQTGATNETSPLGQIGGFANTFDENQYFSQRFEEHGMIIGLAIIRHQRTYQQGLSKFFSRRNMEDFYVPEFQNLGEVAIKNKEIYAQGENVVNEAGEIVDDLPFGYQEYAAEYRQTPNRVSGQFRSNAINTFDNWHYADNYEALPVNGEEWIVENEDAVNRTLTLTSDSGINQFYLDLQFEETNVRTMPPHSIPGFIDHH